MVIQNSHNVIPTFAGLVSFCVLIQHLGSTFLIPSCSPFLPLTLSNFHYGASNIVLTIFYSVITRNGPCFTVHCPMFSFITVYVYTSFERESVYYTSFCHLL